MIGHEHKDFNRPPVLSKILVVEQTMRLAYDGFFTGILQVMQECDIRQAYDIIRQAYDIIRQEFSK
jgi:hypothetical protein